MVSHLSTGEMRDKYFGIRIPPSELRGEDLETARSFARQLIDDSPSRVGSAGRAAPVTA
jgi:hypothetical protein